MDNIFPNRRWLIIPTSITGSIDFNQVIESETTSLRVSVDGTKTFVKYDVNEITESYTNTFVMAETNEEVTVTTNAGIYGRPSSIYSSEYPEYDYLEMTKLMATPEWTNPIEDII